MPAPEAAAGLPWKEIVDRAIWPQPHPFGELAARAALAPLAVAAAGAVPACAVCERLFAALLVGRFGVPESAVTLSEPSGEPCADTLFALGRCGFVDADIGIEGYLSYALTETCIALYDADMARAADGLLALAVIAGRPGVQFSPLQRRFVTQAFGYLAMTADCFADMRGRPVFDKARQRWMPV